MPGLMSFSPLRNVLINIFDICGPVFERNTNISFAMFLRDVWLLSGSASVLIYADATLLLSVATSKQLALSRP